MDFIFGSIGVEVNSTEIKKQWYVVHAFSGMEKTVSKNLEERVRQAGMA